MRLFATRRQWAGALIVALVLALAYALARFATAFLGALVLYVLFNPINLRLRRLFRRPGVAAGSTLIVAVLTVALPLALAAWVLFTEIQSLTAGDGARQLIERLRNFSIGAMAVGPRLVSAGEAVVTWLETGAVGFLGSATRLTISLTITFFTLYFLLSHTGVVWPRVRPFIPFSDENANLLLERFRDVTFSTMLGSGLTAVAQGGLLGLGFWALDVGSPAFWALITAIFSVLPVVGSGIVWGPAAVWIAADGRAGAAIVLALWGALVVANVDMLIRPYVFRRWADIHPLITVVGALAGIPIFGILGILIGPLALSYVFELLRMYQEEYLVDASLIPGATGEMRLPGWRVTARRPGSWS